MRIIVAGSRSISGEPQFRFVCSRLEHFTQKLRKVKIVVACFPEEAQASDGLISGADAMAARWAMMKGYRVEFVSCVTWRKYQRTKKRTKNDEIAILGDCLLMFPGEDPYGYISYQNENLILHAKRFGLQVRVVPLH